jgi:DNA topoisomerase VI subunit B
VSGHRLRRMTFETSRAAEYFSAGELTKQTGQPSRSFGDVVVKELVDNALDAAETAGVAPEVELAALVDGGLLRLSVSDNGSGIPPKDVQRILNFNTRTSDKAAYRSPTRGAQGNALKTVIGIPRALGCDEPIVLEAWGARHTIKPVVDPAGRVNLSHAMDDSDRYTGTKVTVSMPSGDITLSPSYWARAFSLFNPHAFVKLECFEEGSEHPVQIYKPTNPDLNKYKPTDPTSPHWYDTEALGRLIGAHIGHAIDGGEDLPLGEFVRQFRGLKSTAKAKAVCRHLGRTKHLSDFMQDGQLDRLGIHSLLEAMKGETEPPSHKV